MYSTDIRLSGLAFPEARTLIFSLEYITCMNWYISSLLVILLGRWGKGSCLVYTRSKLRFKWKIIKQMLTSTKEGQILTQPVRQDAVHLPPWPCLHRLFTHAFVVEVMDPHDLVPVAPSRHFGPYVIPEPSITSCIHSPLLCPRDIPNPPRIFPVRGGLFSYVFLIVVTVIFIANGVQLQSP